MLMFSNYNYYFCYYVIDAKYLFVIMEDFLILYQGCGVFSIEERNKMNEKLKIKNINNNS